MLSFTAVQSAPLQRANFIESVPLQRTQRDREEHRSSVVGYLVIFCRPNVPDILTAAAATLYPQITCKGQVTSG